MKLLRINQEPLEINVQEDIDRVISIDSILKIFLKSGKTLIGYALVW